jgi:hypothetical protein
VSGGTGAQGGSPGALIDNAASLAAGCGSQVTSNGQVAVAVQTDGGLSLFTFDQAAMTSATAGGSQGSLGVLSKSETTSTPEAYLYTTNGNGGITENEYLARGNSSALASWLDVLTVGGTGNANGFIVLRFSLDLHGQTFSSAASASASILARFFIDDLDRFNGEILELSAPGTSSTTIGFRSGQEVRLYGDLSASTQSSAGRQFINSCGPFGCTSVRGNYLSASDAVADAANTAGFRIDVLTPGGTYSTMSGQTYVTAVPEPATAWLLAAGLLGTIVVMGRRRR